MRLDELRKRGNLPSPKGVALEIMRLVGSQNANTSDIVRVLQASQLAREGRYSGLNLSTIVPIIHLTCGCPVAALGATY